MGNETKYKYQKRIKELEERVSNLLVYRAICEDVHNAIMGLWQENKTVSIAWITRQFKRAWK